MYSATLTKPSAVSVTQFYSKWAGLWGALWVLSSSGYFKARKTCLDRWEMPEFHVKMSAPSPVRSVAIVPSLQLLQTPPAGLQVTRQHKAPFPCQKQTQEKVLFTYEILSTIAWYEYRKYRKTEDNKNHLRGASSTKPLSKMSIYYSFIFPLSWTIYWILLEK